MAHGVLPAWSETLTCSPVCLPAVLTRSALLLTGSPDPATSHTAMPHLDQNPAIEYLSVVCRLAGVR